MTIIKSQTQDKMGLLKLTVLIVLFAVIAVSAEEAKTNEVAVEENKDQELENLRAFAPAAADDDDDDDDDDLTDEDAKLLNVLAREYDTDEEMQGKSKRGWRRFKRRLRRAGRRIGRFIRRHRRVIKTIIKGIIINSGKK